MTSISPYKKRNFTQNGAWACDGVQFKVYGITVDTSVAISDQLYANAKKYIDLNLPEVRAKEGSGHGLGYVILHAGEVSNWLLIHWWAYEDIAMRMLASADIGKTEFTTQDHRHFHACVWEHVVIDYERNSWVRMVMQKDSDPTLYIKDQMNEGMY